MNLLKTFSEYMNIEPLLEKEFKQTGGWLKKKKLDEFTKAMSDKLSFDDIDLLTVDEYELCGNSSNQNNNNNNNLEEYYNDYEKYEDVYENKYFEEKTKKEIKERKSNKSSNVRNEITYENIQEYKQNKLKIIIKNFHF